VRLLLLALRNLGRNRRRTLLSLAVVAAGTIGLVLTAGFIRFSFDGLREALIHGGLGHFEVARRAAVEGRRTALDRAASEGIAKWQGLRQEIERLPHVLAAGGNQHAMGLVSTPAGRSVSFIGVGSEPARDRRMGFPVQLRAGEALPDAPPLPGEDGVLLAVGLAESLGVKPGDTVTLMTLNADGLLNALDARVRGIVTTGVADLDTRFLKAHLASTQRLLQTDSVSDLIVTFDSVANAEAGRGALAEAIAPQADLSLVEWRARAPFFDQVRNLYLGIFWFLGAIIFMLVVLSASNTLVMTVMERVREIGTLRAIGTSGGQVAGLILGEALWLGLIGGVIGDVLGVALIRAINALDLKMPPPPGAVSAIDLRLAIVPQALYGAAGLMLLVLALASLAPIARSLRLRIAEALAHV
jgi:putative ABC transport system permease protein